MPELSNFPFLSSTEFEQACESLLPRLFASSLEVTLRKEQGTCFLVIKKPIDTEVSKTLHFICPGIEDDSEEGEEDDDKEALPFQSKRTSLTAVVEYHILLSPSYQAPVLYFQITARSSGTPLSVSLSDIYTILVSANSRVAVEKVGIIGGISQGDHPVLGLPYYFVHPCNTVDAMREWEREWEKGMGPEAYLGIWMGLVGGVVGLWMPGGDMVK